MPVLGQLNERAVLIEEVWEAVKKIKVRKAPWFPWFSVECLKKGGSITVYIRMIKEAVKWMLW